MRRKEVLLASMTHTLSQGPMGWRGICQIPLPPRADNVFHQVGPLEADYRRALSLLLSPAGHEGLIIPEIVSQGKFAAEPGDDH
jgi:hypothetical protein